MCHAMLRRSGLARWLRLSWALRGCYALLLPCDDPSALQALGYRSAGTVELVLDRGRHSLTARRV